MKLRDLARIGHLFSALIEALGIKKKTAVGTAGDWVGKGSDAVDLFVPAEEESLQVGRLPLKEDDRK